MGIINWFRAVRDALFPPSTISNALGVDIAIDDNMARAIDLWADMYHGAPPWLSGTTRTLNIPATIAGEIARMVTLEMQSRITGSARAEYLDSQYRPIIQRARVITEYACAKGGVMIKPYIDNNGIAIDCVHAGRFYPTAYDSNDNITGVIFVAQKSVGTSIYTRLEQHSLVGDTYTINNSAYRSNTPGVLGVRVSLTDVDEWAELEDTATIQPIDRPLYAYFRMPMANVVNPTSPLGVSVYAKAVDTIQQVDKLYSDILWEYEGSQLAIDADITTFRRDSRTGNLIMPKGRERLFRALDLGEGTDRYHIFSPQIRDTSLFNGLNQLLTKIEDQCCVAHGTLSVPDAEARTATEIKILKQRTYATVADIQKALQNALDNLVYAMDVWATLGELAPAGQYEISYKWDDSIIVDTQSEQAIRLQEVGAGLLRPEAYLMWRYGVTEEDAKAMLPEISGMAEI